MLYHNWNGRAERTFERCPRDWQAHEGLSTEIQDPWDRFMSLETLIGARNLLSCQILFDH